MTAASSSEDAVRATASLADGTRIREPRVIPRMDTASPKILGPDDGPIAVVVFLPRDSPKQG
jgi:hypothetical protein